MDAFSVSCANALLEPGMKLMRMSLIAGVYGAFQFMMPMLGWTFVHTIEERFVSFQPFIPWIALVLLVWIGGKMLIEGIREQRRTGGGGPGSLPGASGLDKGSPDAVPAAGKKPSALTLPVLLLQGTATSIDALSVGFTIAGYDLGMALTSCMIIGAVTFIICMAGLAIGKKAGMKLAGKAGIIGGLILIAIGLEIVISSFI